MRTILQPSKADKRRMRNHKRIMRMWEDLTLDYPDMTANRKQTYIADLLGWTREGVRKVVVKHLQCKEDEG